jgi:hypothetical protein
VSRARPPRSPAVIDACCLIDLLVTGRAAEILRASGFTWHLPIAVRDEVRYVRRHDPARAGGYLDEPVDLGPYLTAGLLTPCQPSDEHEQEQFVRYAARFCSEGEAMCLALARSRGWTVATDDRKAIRVAAEEGLTVISCPGLVKAWADATRPDPGVIERVLSDIETLVRFRPGPSMPGSSWWSRYRPAP